MINPPSCSFPAGRQGLLQNLGSAKKQPGMEKSFGLKEDLRIDVIFKHRISPRKRGTLFFV